MATKGLLKALASLGSIALAGMAQPGAATDQQNTNLPPASVEAFLLEAEEKLDAASQESSRAEWVHATNITPDTAWLSSLARERLATLSLRIARQASSFDRSTADPSERRKLDLLRRLASVPPPSGAAAAARLAALQTSLSGQYATGSFLYKGQPTSLAQAEALLAKTRDPEEARLLWEGWRDSAKALKPDYIEMATLANEGARELGYADMGELWRSGYDRSPARIEAEVDAEWDQLQPLYKSLHCFMRKKLSERYGTAVQPRTGPIRAHLLGNMWGQNWGNLFDIAKPGKLGQPDIDAYLEKAGYDPLRMVKSAEGFYTSLGFEPLPASFWTSSLFAKPVDRKVDCNPSAWSIDNRTDVRLKMCIRVTRSQFVTVYHELGHNFYNLAYADQPFLFRKGADDGFHEGIGDFIALSAVAPAYYKTIGILPEDAAEGDDVGMLLQQALDKVPLLPFAIALDKWRWGILAGRISPDEFNSSWWKLVAEYQGMVPPRPRPEDGFDAGAKYHVPENVPYISYLKARIYQYQFHEAACRIAKWKGSLHRCSIYGNKEVGEKLRAMLALGGSRPNSEALALFTGSAEADPRAMLEYYRPLMRWLDKQNEGERCGW